MSSIGAIGSYGGSRVGRSRPLAARIRQKIQDNGGKTEAQIHLELAKKQAKLDNPEESLHMRLTREANEKPDQNLHLKLSKEKNDKPAHLDQNNIHARATEAATSQSKHDAASKLSAAAIAVQGSPAEKAMAEMSDPAKQAAAASQSDPARQGTSVDALSAGDMGDRVADRTQARSLRATSDRFDPMSFANQGAESLRRQREVEAYDPNGQAVRAGGQQPGALLNVFA